MVWWRWLLAGIAVLVVWLVVDMVKRLGVWVTLVWVFVLVCCLALCRFVVYVRSEHG